MTRASGMAVSVAACCAVVFALVVARVGQLQTQSDERLEAAVGSRVALTSASAVRGSLYDRRGRVIAATEFKWRVFVDPTSFPSEPGEAVVRLADVLGLGAGSVGASVVGWMSWNEAEARRSASGDDRPRLRQYVPVSGAIGGDVAERVRELGIEGVHLERLPVRSYPAGDDVAALAGKVGTERRGLLGMEHAFDGQLRGAEGRGRYVRDARRRPLWIEPGSWRAAERGVDVRSSVDLMIQRIAVEELHRGVIEADAAGGRIVVVDPQTGEVLAIADLVREIDGVSEYPWWPVGWAASGPVEVPRARYDTLHPDSGRAKHAALARNRCVEDVYEPGSSFKPFVWAAVLEAGLVEIDEVFDTEGGGWLTPYGRPIFDVTRRDEMTWAEVLENSSNIGMVKAADRMSARALRTVVRELGFGSPTGVGLPGEAAGIVQSAGNWSHYTQTSVAFGHEVAVTPMQMVRAFSAFCRTGERSGTMPDLTLRATDSGGAGVLRRVFRADTTLAVRRILERVASKVEAKMERDSGEAGWRYSLFGKSGTADIPLGAAPEGHRRPPGAEGFYPQQYNSSFVGGAPVGEPRVAVIVVIDDPGPALVDARRHYGSNVAGPVVRRVVERALAYMRVEPDIGRGEDEMAGAGAIAGLER
ncbi:MAG: penicillin-binding protein 2 [Planctomycetota bacterium]